MDETNGGLKVEVSDIPGGIACIVAGELDISTALYLVTTIDETGITDVDHRVTDPKTIELNTAGVWFVDSSGLEALLSLRPKVQRPVLVDPSPQLQRLLEVTRVGTLFEISHGEPPR